VTYPTIPTLSPREGPPLATRPCTAEDSRSNDDVETIPRRHFVRDRWGEDSESSLLERAAERIRFQYRNRDGYEIVAQPFLIALLLRFGVSIASGIIDCVNGVAPGSPTPTFDRKLPWFGACADQNGLLLTLVFLACVGWRVRATMREIADDPRTEVDEPQILLVRLWYWRQFARVAIFLSMAGFVGSLGLTHSSITTSGVDNGITHTLQVVGDGGFSVVDTTVWIFVILGARRVKNECDTVFFALDEVQEGFDTTVEWG
jgi:hypothetical protein